MSPAASSFDLPDVNVWLALAHPGHAHHIAAKKYWLNAQSPLVFCRISMQGFLRLITQKAVMGEATHTTQEAWTIYDAHLSGGRTTFLHESDALEAQTRHISTQVAFHARDWTDVWLASFAITAGCRLVSFNNGFEQYGKAGLDFLWLRNDAT